MYCIVGTRGFAAYHISTFQSFVLDMELPDMSGMDIIVRIREKDPQARIIVNTMHEEIWFIKT